jgi:hypothetical protein
MEHASSSPIFIHVSPRTLDPRGDAIVNYIEQLNQSQAIKNLLAFLAHLAFHESGFVVSFTRIANARYFPAVGRAFFCRGSIYFKPTQ